jgi:hypothetical protein
VIQLDAERSDEFLADCSEPSCGSVRRLRASLGLLGPGVFAERQRRTYLGD